MTILEKNKNLKENDTPINAFPEYKIRTMKDDLLDLGIEKLQKEAKKTKKTKKIEPPEELPIVSKKPKFISKPPKPKKIKKAPLPSMEELISSKLSEPPKPKKEKKIKELKVKKPKKWLAWLLIVILITAIVIIIFYLAGSKPAPSSDTDEQPELETPIISESLIPVDETKIIHLSTEISFLDLLKQESEKDQLAGTFKRIAILKNETEFLSLNELLKKLNINIPPYALVELKENYTLAIYNQNGKAHLCLVTETKNSEALKEQLTFWEQTMVNDLESIFLDLPFTISTDSVFRDSEYKGISFRYIKLPNFLLGIAYSIVDDKLLITTAKESFRSAIDRLSK